MPSPLAIVKNVKYEKVLEQTWYQQVWKIKWFSNISVCVGGRVAKATVNVICAFIRLENNWRWTRMQYSVHLTFAEFHFVIMLEFGWDKPRSPSPQSNFHPRVIFYLPRKKSDVSFLWFNILQNNFGLWLFAMRNNEKWDAVLIIRSILYIKQDCITF